MQGENTTPELLCGVAGGAGGRPGRDCLSVFFPLDGHKLRDARLLHGDAVEDRAHFHGLAIVRDDDELRLAAHFRERILLKRPTFASSRGASTSSRMQNGLGE